MSVNHSLEYIRTRMKVLKEEQDRQRREIDDLQMLEDSLKSKNVKIEEWDKREQDSNKRGLDDLQMQLDAFKAKNVRLGDSTDAAAHDRNKRLVLKSLQKQLDSLKDKNVRIEERDKRQKQEGRKEIFYFQMELDAFEAKSVKLEEWDNEFMWSPTTKFLYDYDGNKVGIVKDVNDAIIEFI